MAARMRIGGILVVALVVMGAAARPLHEELTSSQGAKVLAFVVPAVLLPALLVRYALARRWALFAVLSCLFSVGIIMLLGVIGSKAPLPKGLAHLQRQPVATSGGTTSFRTVTTRTTAAPHTSVALSGTFVAVLVLLFALVIVTAIVIALRRQPPPAPAAPLRKLKQPEPEEMARRFYSLVGDSLDDLRAEEDPRKAVIAAYARMQRGLDSLGVERLLSETPFEYLGRVLDRLSVSDEAARRLTDLFERAKFSAAPIGEEMKADAVAALEAIREEAKKWAA